MSIIDALEIGGFHQVISPSINASCFLRWIPLTSKWIIDMHAFEEGSTCTCWQALLPQWSLFKMVSNSTTRKVSLDELLGNDMKNQPLNAHFFFSFVIIAAFVIVHKSTGQDSGSESPVAFCNKVYETSLQGTCVSSNLPTWLVLCGQNDHCHPAEKAL